MTNENIEDLRTALLVIKTSLHLLETKVATAENVLSQANPNLYAQYQTALDSALLGPLSDSAKTLGDIRTHLKNAQ